MRRCINENEMLHVLGIRSPIVVYNQEKLVVA